MGSRVWIHVGLASVMVLAMCGRNDGVLGSGVGSTTGGPLGNQPAPKPNVLSGTVFGGAWKVAYARAIRTLGSHSWTVSLYSEASTEDPCSLTYSPRTDGRYVQFTLPKAERGDLHFVVSPSNPVRIADWLKGISALAYGTGTVTEVTRRAVKATLNVKSADGQQVVAGPFEFPLCTFGLP